MINNPYSGNPCFGLMPIKGKKPQTTPHTNTHLPKGVHFCGLTGKLGKELYATRGQIIDIVANEAEKRQSFLGIAGNLPEEWINLIPKENRNKTVPEVYKIFKQVAAILNCNSPSLKKAAEKLYSGLTSANIAHEAGKIEYLGTGRYGSAYKIGINGESYVLKTFHPHSEPSNWHGSLIEANRGLFWNKNYPKSQFVKLYFSDTLDSYHLVKYVDHKTPRPIKAINEKLVGVDIHDENIAENMINGNYFDFGQQEVVFSELSRNKDLRRKLADSYESFTKMPEKERINFIEQEKYPTNLKNEFRFVLIGDMQKFSDTEKVSYFNNMFGKLDKRLDTAFNNKLWELVRGGPNSFIHTLFEESSPELKFHCFDNLYRFKPNGVNIALKKFAQTEDPQISCALAKNLNKIEDEAENAKYFKLLLKGANQDVKEILAKDIFLLPKKNREEYFDLLSPNADIRLKRKLASAVFFLPRCQDTDKRFMQLAKEPDIGIKRTLIGNLFILKDPKLVTACFDDFSKSADKDILKDLIKNLGILRKTSVVKYFERLAASNDAELTPLLKSQLHLLPAETKAKWENIFKLQETS